MFVGQCSPGHVSRVRRTGDSEAGSEMAARFMIAFFGNRSAKVAGLVEVRVPDSEGKLSLKPFLSQ